MTQHPKKRQAAAVIIRALRRRNRQTGEQVRKALASHGLTEAKWLAVGVRVIRDVYGANALVYVGEQRGKPGRYVLDPQVYEGQAWALKMSKRGLTEARHVEHVLKWLADEYGNRGVVRRARRYAANLIEELEEMTEALKNGAPA